MTRALILGLALFCGKLMADPCDDMLIQTAGAQAQQQAVYDASQQPLNSWTPIATGATVVAEYQAGNFNVLEIQVPVELTYPGQPNAPYTTYTYFMTANLLNRQISFSTQAEIDIATAPPPPVIVNPLPVVINTDQIAMDLANQYAASYALLRVVVGLTIESETPMGFVSQYSYIANISNGDVIRITFQVDGNGNVTHLSSFEI